MVPAVRRLINIGPPSQRRVTSLKRVSSPRAAKIGFDYCNFDGDAFIGFLGIGDFGVDCGGYDHAAHECTRSEGSIKLHAKPRSKVGGVG